MQSWEIVIIAVGAALIAVCIYLISVLKSANNTLAKINELLESNSPGVNKVITNAGTISDDVGDVCSRAKDAVTKITDAVSAQTEESGKALPSSGDSPALRSVITAVSVVFSGLKVMKRFADSRRTKKLLRELKKKN